MQENLNIKNFNSFDKVQDLKSKNMFWSKNK